MSLHIALAHAERGRRVFPFRLIAKKGGKSEKRPLVPWKDEATTDAAAIRAWWTKYPSAAVGWVLPDGIVVLDIDDAQAFAEAKLDLPEAPSQSTPSGGSHHVFSTNGREVRQTVKVIPGADTRVGGKGWVGVYSADSFDGEPPLAPEWLYASKKEEPASTDAEDMEPMTSHDELVSFAGRMRFAGLDAGDILNALHARRDDGRIGAVDDGWPWSDDDLERIAKDMGAKATGDWSPPLPVRRVRTGDVLDPWYRGDEIDEETAKPLVLGCLDPDDHTILFGDGGTGKGIVAAWWIAQLTSSGKVVAILDYERHAKYEWKPRIRSFGGDETMYYVRQPLRPIWDIANDVASFDCDWIVVDSIAYASVGAEVEKSTTAILYSDAIARIGKPALSLAHTTKENADPRHPFGSVFWSNGARITIGMAGTGREDRILTNKKTNQRAPFAPLVVDWTWVDTGIPSTLVVRGASVSVRDRVHAALGDTGSMTIDELGVALGTDGGSAIPAETIKKTLLRNPQNFVGDGARPQLWARALTVRRVPKAVKP